MTEQEKLKLAQIIAKRLCPNRKLHFNLYGDKANCYSYENFAECQTVTDTVDDIIAAGLTFDGEWKHRAEVAERAARDLIAYYCSYTIENDIDSSLRVALQQAEKELAEEKKE